jgi:hypothetical protein
MLPFPWLDRGAHLADSVSRAGGPWVKAGLNQVAAHTGIPVVVVAAIGLVMSYRLAKRSLRFIVEVGFAIVLVVTLTELGWIKF